MSENELLNPSSTISNNTPQNVPNSTAVLVLGIISLVFCFAGLVTGIIALVLHKKDKEVYLSNPVKYEQSYKNSKAGYICAIVGVCLQAFIIVFYVLYFIFIISVISNLPH